MKLINIHLGKKSKCAVHECMCVPEQVQGYWVFVTPKIFVLTSAAEALNKTKKKFTQKKCFELA